MSCVAVDGVFSGLPASIVIERLSCIRVHVKAWKVAAGYVEADLMTVLEDQRCWIHLDCELVGFAGLEQFGFRQVVAVSCSHDAISDIQIDARRKIRIRRVHIDELGSEIRIQSVRGSPQLYDKSASDLDILRKRRSLKYDDIAASREWFRIGAQPEFRTASLVRRTCAHQISLRRDGPANGRRWISRIEGVSNGPTVAGLPGRERSVRMKIVRCRPGACQWPFLFIAPVPSDEQAALRCFVPVTATHHIDPDGGLPLHTVIDALQPAVEPARPQ